jgi:hypothetical protein
MPNNCNLQYIFTYILQWNKFDNWDSGTGIGQQIRKVCRCQKGDRKSYIEEGQAMQWPSEKGQNEKQWSTKNYTENWRLSSTNPTFKNPDGILSVTTWVFSFTLYGSSRFCMMINQSDCTKYLNATKICRK